MPLSPFALSKYDGGKGFISSMRRTRKQLLVHYLRRVRVRAGAVLQKVEQPNKRVMGRMADEEPQMNTYICVALHCPPGTITALLISYTQMQNTEFKKS